MALDLSNLRYESAGSEKKVIGTMAFDSSYPTGGEALTAKSVGFNRITRLKLQPEQVLRHVPKPRPHVKPDFRRPGLKSAPLSEQDRRFGEQWVVSPQYSSPGD